MASDQNTKSPSPQLPDEKQHTFLRALERGDDFTKAATDLGVEDHLRVPFGCVLAGWVSQGQLTETGREALRQAWLARVP